MLPTVVVRGRRNPLHFGLPARLKRAREHLSYSSVADAAGISDGQIVFRVERKPDHVPRCDTVEKIAYALGLSPAFLAYGIEDHTTRPCDGLRCEGVASRLLTTRVARGLSMRALARAAGLTDTAVRTTETGATMPGIDTAEALSNALGVSPGWLAYGLGPVELPNRRAIRAKPTQAAPSESDTTADGPS